MRRATLRIGVVRVNPGAHHELTLVGLADIDVNRVRHHHAVQHRLEQLGDGSLQGMALDRKVETGHRGEDGAVTGRANGHAAGRDRTATGLHTDDAVALQVEAGDLAFLDQVHAHLVRLAGEGPGDVVVLGDAAPALQRTADHRVTHV